MATVTLTNLAGRTATVTHAELEISPVLREQASSGRIFVQNVSSGQFDQLVLYLRTGKFMLETWANLINMLTVSHKMGIQNLSRKIVLCLPKVTSFSVMSDAQARNLLRLLSYSPGVLPPKDLKKIEWGLYRPPDSKIPDRSADSRTIAHMLALSNNLPALQYEYDKKGLPPDEIFWAAIDTENMGVLKWLNQARPLASFIQNKGEVLAYIADLGDLKLFKWLHQVLHLTTDDIRFNENETIRAAASAGHLDVVKWLVHTFNLTPEDIKEANALGRAEDFGHVEVAQLLKNTFGITDEDW